MGGMARAAGGVAGYRERNVQGVGREEWRRRVEAEPSVGLLRSRGPFSSKETYTDKTPRFSRTQSSLRGAAARGWRRAKETTPPFATEEDAGGAYRFCRLFFANFFELFISSSLARSRAMVRLSISLHVQWSTSKRAGETKSLLAFVHPFPFPHPPPPPFLLPSRPLPLLFLPPHPSPLRPPPDDVRFPRCRQACRPRLCEGRCAGQGPV